MSDKAASEAHPRDFGAQLALRSGFTDCARCPALASKSGMRDVPRPRGGNRGQKCHRLATVVTFRGVELGSKLTTASLVGG